MFCSIHCALSRVVTVLCSGAGWDQRLVSVANSAAPSSAAATDPSRFWNTAQTGPNSAAAPRDLASKQSLQKLDSGLIPEVFGTRDSLQESSFELQATSEQKSPSQAALAAQAMAAQVCIAVLWLSSTNTH